MNEIREELQEVQHRQDRLETFVRGNGGEEPPPEDVIPNPKIDIQTWVGKFSKQQPPSF